MPRLGGSASSLMVAQPMIALDLPLKVLAWEATDGKVWVSYNDPNYLKQRFSLSDELVKNIAIIAPLINEALSSVDHK
ncbi:MAG TPA: DUF302 domain-containing protein [Leptolyngbyaceae cyanobacterium]